MSSTKIKRPSPMNILTNGSASSGSGARSATRPRREGQLLGRGQRNSSVGLRSTSIVGELALPHAEPQPYVKSDEYILKKYRGNPPSLIIHLHPAHFRLDQQEGSFSYKSPMKIMIEHLKLRTIPHDLAEFFTTSNVPFYEGCMIVQIVDHKSLAPSQSLSRTDTGSGKTVPFSIHNSNAYLTPSPYVPFPIDNQGDKVKACGDGTPDGSGNAKSAEKENMLFPVDGLRGKVSAQPKKPKVTTIVLNPTPISNFADMALKAADARSNSLDGRESRHDMNGPLSATVPPTPLTAIPPPTPSTSMAPPAKRLKKMKVGLDSNNIHAAEAQITFATTAPLMLDTVSSATESATLIESLAHPMHSEKPPSPKTRKRTVAEMEADEALAAEQERYMLILDERLSTVGAQGGANHADGDGQAGGASFEPRFERFKTLENIKNQHEENKKAEKARQQELQRKETQDKERERLRKEAEVKEQERTRQLSLQQQANNRELQQRRVMAQAQAGQHQPGLQGVPPQPQGQQIHPQANGGMVNGIQSQPQRFHQQQASQTQVSSPIVRNGTPQNHSSPIVNNMGNVPMQQSTSSMGGSPPRPGSVVHQNHPQMGAQGMVAQRSQQSHAGTPRMPNATPNVQSTPRPMNQTPRMSQSSPLQGQMAPTPNPMMMAPNSQMTPQQQQMMMNQQIMRRQQQQQQQQQAMQNLGVMNGQPMTQQQQFLMMRQQHIAHAQQQQHANQMPNSAGLAQNYQAQMVAMAGRQQNVMPGNMGFNSPGIPNNMAQLQMQHAQQLAAQQLAQAQAQQQAHAHAQQGAQMNAQQMTPQQIMSLQITRQAQSLFQLQIGQHRTQYPNGQIPQDVLNNIKMSCHATAQQQVQQNMRRRQMMQQQQAAGLQNMQQMNGMHMNGQQQGI